MMLQFQCRSSSRLPRELGDSLFIPKEWSNMSTSSDFPWKGRAGFAELSSGDPVFPSTPKVSP